MTFPVALTALTYSQLTDALDATNAQRLDYMVEGQPVPTELAALYAALTTERRDRTNASVQA